MTSPISTVLFDLDGTLVNSLADLRQSVNHTLVRHGRPPLEEATVRSYIGDGVRVLAARALLGWREPAIETEYPLELRRERWEARRRSAVAELMRRASSLESPSLEEAIGTFRAYYAQHSTDHTRLYEGVDETLDALAACGIGLAIVSNKPESDTIHIAETLGIRDRFSCIVGGDTVAETKPSPMPLEHAMRALSAKPDSTLMVGDSINDLIAGRNANCMTAMVTFGLGDPEILSLYDADFVLDSITQLEDFV